MKLQRLLSVKITMAAIDREALEKEYRKLTARNDDIIRQEATSKKEYATFSRKETSIITLLQSLEPTLQDMHELKNNEPRLISEETIAKVPGLSWYNEQIKLVQESGDKDDFDVPPELKESYELFKGLALLPKDGKSLSE